MRKFLIEEHLVGFGAEDNNKTKANPSCSKKSETLKHHSSQSNLHKKQSSLHTLPNSNLFSEAYTLNSSLSLTRTNTLIKHTSPKHSSKLTQKKVKDKITDCSCGLNGNLETAHMTKLEKELNTKLEIMRKSLIPPLLCEVQETVVHEPIKLVHTQYVYYGKKQIINDPRLMDLYRKRNGIKEEKVFDQMGKANVDSIQTLELYKSKLEQQLAGTCEGVCAASAAKKNAQTFNLSSFVTKTTSGISQFSLNSNTSRNEAGNHLQLKEGRSKSGDRIRIRAMGKSCDWTKGDEKFFQTYRTNAKNRMPGVTTQLNAL